MDVSDKKLETIIGNEKEWRRELFKQVAETNKELHNFKLEMTIITTSLKIKVGLAGTFFGLVGGGIVSFALKSIN